MDCEILRTPPIGRQMSEMKKAGVVLGDCVPPSAVPLGLPKYTAYPADILVAPANH